MTAGQLPARDPDRCDICGDEPAVRYVTADLDDPTDETASRYCCLAHLPTSVETVGRDGTRPIRVERLCRPDPRRPR